jgi:hypothetical protein
MPSQIITSIGLCSDIFGAILLFKYGLPPDFDPLGRDFIITSTTSEAEKGKGDYYRLWGKVGLILLIVGFCLQLAGTWITRLST